MAKTTGYGRARRAVAADVRLQGRAGAFFASRGQTLTRVYNQYSGKGTAKARKVTTRYEVETKKGVRTYTSKQVARMARKWRPSA